MGIVNEIELNFKFNEIKKVLYEII